MEACATAHQWAREVKKLGHDTRLMPPTYVKAYVKRGKNDAADAAAICEAVTRPSMRFVPIKNVEQHSVLMLHRTRDLLIRQRTQLINALRAHLAELGLVAAKGREGVHQLVTVVTECGGERLPSNARFACQAIVTQLHAVQIEISGLDKRITQTHRVNADSKRLDTILGFGVILSTAVVATMTDPKAFKTGREFAAWIGLVPRQNSTGGKDRLGSFRGCARTIPPGGATGEGWGPGVGGGRPTRWRGSPGPCWPRASRIGRQHAQATPSSQRRPEPLTLHCKVTSRT